MLKKIILHLWSARHEFIRYFIVGVSSFVVDFGTLIIFKKYFGWSPVLSIVVNQIIIVIMVFSLNKKWSFKSDGVAHKEGMRFLLLASFNYVFAIGWMWFWNEHLGFNYLLVRFANVVLAIGWNFLLYKHWVYAKRSVDAR